MAPVNQEKQNVKSPLTDKTIKALFNKANHHAKKHGNANQTLNFLKLCLKNNIIPRTFCVRSSPRNDASTTTQHEWNNAKFKASLQLVKIAIKDSEDKVKKTLELLSKSLDELREEAITQNNNDVLRMIDKNQLKYIRIAQNEAKKRFYKLKHPGIDIEKVEGTTNDEGDKNKKRKSRRFIKRTQFRRKVEKKRKERITLLHNYSSVELTKPMKSLLERGLNFAVTPSSFNLSEILLDFRKFERKVKWKEFWYIHGDGETLKDYVPPIFKSEKTNLPRNTSKEVDSFISGVRGEIIGTPANKIHSNITPLEREALRTLIQLQKDRKLIIKLADKGGGIVLMNFTDYMESCKNHLQAKTPNGKNYYSRSTEKDLIEAKKAIKSTLDEGRKLGFIDSTEHIFMDPTEKGPGKFYQIIKVHKDHEEGQLPPGRPIISGSNSITEQISYFIDCHGKDLVQELPSYLQDTPDFLRQLEEINQAGLLHSEAVPVSIDVCGLYTNIPIQEGIESFREALDRRQNQDIPTSYLIKLLTLVLTLNIFEFDSELYSQLFGTAMGTRVAPTFANLFMGKIDEYIRRIAKQFAAVRGRNPIILFRRFIDDLFFIWCGNESQLVKFIKEINLLHPTIKFTASYDFTSRSTHYLDTTVWISEGKIHTDLYRKKTDKVQYLLPSSCHPSHVTKNIPYSLGLRIVRICSDLENRINRLQELREMLISRYYRPKSVDNAILKVKLMDREMALQKVEKKKNDRITFALRYYPQLPPISQILHRHWRAMTIDPEMKKIFPEPPMVAFKKLPNLKQQLIRTKLPSTKLTQSKRIQNGLKKCNKPRCKICPYISEGRTVGSKNTTAEAILSNVVTCDTTYVVYVISCCKCGAQYIGETKRALKKRISEHISYIEKNIEATGLHFNTRGHKLADMMVQVIEKVSPETKPLLEIREKFWIQKFGTKFGIGLNKQS